MAAFAAVDGLTLRHVGRKIPALRELSLRWDEGERLLLVGPSGSGKSTLALCLDGLIPHAIEAHWEAGRVTVGGRDTRETALAELTSRVGVVFQDPDAQLVMLEVDDEIAFGLENRGVPPEEMGARIAEARALVGLGSDTPSRIAWLSGGTKQRLAIAAVLASRPEALVLDEPTANLDPAGAAAVLRSIETLVAERRRSILLIEHRIDLVLGLIDRVIVLDASGSCAVEGTPAEVFVTRRERVAALGVHTPELGDLAALLGSSELPADARRAGGLLAERWPQGIAVPAPRSPLGPALLRCEEVRHGYAGAAADAVAGAGLEVRPGGITALVGANGAGKSTLGMIAAGVLAPTAGRVTIGGRDLRELSPPERRARIAYVFQYPEHQFLAGTVRDELTYGLRARGIRGPELARRTDTLLERSGLGRLAQANPHALSHGEKRRLSVATALVTEPEIVVLDEPTFGQDRRSLRSLAGELREVAAQGRGVLLITHDLSLVADLADRVIALERGQVAYDGPPNGLFALPDVLTRCGLVVPPAAAAIRLAAASRPELAPARGLDDLRAALGAQA